MNRHNRRLARLELKPALLQFFLEELRIRPKLLHQLLAFRRVQQRERSLARSRRSRRVRSRKQKRPRPQIEKINQIPRTAYIPSHGPDGLAERPYLDMHPSMAFEVINRSASSAPQHTARVRVVHHHDAAVFP